MSKRLCAIRHRRYGAEFADLLQARCPRNASAHGLPSGQPQVANGATPKSRSSSRASEQLPRSCIGHPKEKRAAASDERAADLDHSGRPAPSAVVARGTDLTVVRIASDLLKRIARESGMRAVEVVGQYGTFDPVIWHLGRAVRAELRRHRQLDGTYLQSVAVVLTRQLLSTYVTAVLPFESGGLPRFKLRRAIEYMHEHMAGDISFRDVAAHVRMSAYHFARMFRQSTGVSPHNYIVRCRMERAKALLAEARLPISDVAFEVGYKESEPLHHLLRQSDGCHSWRIPRGRVKPRGARRPWFKSSESNRSFLGEARMDLSIGDARNGATWIRDCLIDGSAMSRAIDRLQVECRSGIRHFSAIGVAVSLDKAQSVESDLLRLEAELDVGGFTVPFSAP